jgi:broad specificity phosphatase PhoE
MKESSYDALNLQYSDVDSRAKANPDLGTAAELYHDNYSFRKAFYEKPFEYHLQDEIRKFDDDMRFVNTSIVFTHSHRLRCIFTLLCGDKYNSDYRFKNNSVILLRLTPVKGNPDQFEYDIHLLVNGVDDDSDDKGQWCLTENRARLNDREFKPIKGRNDFKSLRPYEPMFSKEQQDTKLEKIEYIYLVRHGKAEHNKKNYSMIWHIGWNDTNLIDNQESVKEAALQIYNFMVEKGTHEITTLCVSDLQRTQQTFEIFMEQFQSINLRNIPSVGSRKLIQNPDRITLPSKVIVLPSKVIVLPCSHELTYVKNGRCDGNITQKFNINSPFTAENRTSFYSPNLKSMNQHLVKNQDLYDNMYGSTKRGIFHYINPFKGNNRCRFTSFLEILVEYNSKNSQRTSNQKNNLPPSSSSTRNAEIGISYQGNDSPRDSSRITEIWSDAPKPVGNGGRSRRKSRRKSIRKRSKKRRN